MPSSISYSTNTSSVRSFPSPPLTPTSVSVGGGMGVGEGILEKSPCGSNRIWTCELGGSAAWMVCKSYLKPRDLAVWNDVDGTRGYYAK